MKLFLQLKKIIGKAKNKESKNPVFISIKTALFVFPYETDSRKFGVNSPFVIEYPKKPKTK